MGRRIRKTKQTFIIAEDCFGQSKSAFEFNYQDMHGIHTTWNPNMDIFETEENFVIVVEAAGLDEETLHLHAVDNRMILNGERKLSLPEPVIRYHQLEIQFMPFQKTIILPGRIEVSKVKAQYKDGFLTIVVSKNALNKG